MFSDFPITPQVVAQIEKGLIPDGKEKTQQSIERSDLGITPSNDGHSIRLPFPQPTEERRKELVRDCKQLAEERRISIRNARKDANRAIDRDEELSEDEQNAEKKRVQNLTDKYNKIVDERLKAKTDEVMSI